MPTQTQQIPIGGKLTSTQPQQLSIIELSALYDRVYDIADRLFKKYNPCNIHTIKGGICCTSRKTNNAFGLCCGGCKHISKTGCTVRCLPCKLFICDTLMYVYDNKGKWIRNKKYKHFVDKFERLQVIAKKYGIYTYAYFRTKSEILDISEKQRKKGNKPW